MQLSTYTLVTLLTAIASVTSSQMVTGTACAGNCTYPSVTPTVAPIPTSSKNQTVYSTGTGSVYPLTNSTNGTYIAPSPSSPAVVSSGPGSGSNSNGSSSPSAPAAFTGAGSKTAACSAALAGVLGAFVAFL